MILNQSQNSNVSCDHEVNQSKWRWQQSPAKKVEIIRSSTSDWTPSCIMWPWSQPIRKQTVYNMTGVELNHKPIRDSFEEKIGGEEFHTAQDEIQFCYFFCTQNESVLYTDWIRLTRATCVYLNVSIFVALSMALQINIYVYVCIWILYINYQKIWTEFVWYCIALKLELLKYY